MGHRKSLPFYVLIAVGVVLLMAVARVPVAAYVPLLVLAACPIMMMFMMKNMKHGSDDHGAETRTTPDDGRR